MLSATLGSQGASHARTPLNVVFIIDTFLPPPQAPETGEAQTEKAVAFLKRSLVRILIYFHCNMDAKFQWTYQFFNSRLNQDIGLMPNRVLRSLSTSTVTTCMDEYRKIIAAESSPTSLPKKGSSSSSGSKSVVSPCYTLRRQLVHSLADFGLDIASYQSPMKTASSLRSQSLQKHFQPVSIRNYMYIMSPLPRTWTETVTFLEGKPQSRNDRIVMEPRKSEIIEVLKGVKDAFFEQGLWDRFLDQRTSLSWINTATKSIPEEPIKPQTRVSATALIQSTLELTMKAFGGHIIPQQVVCQTLPPRDVYSFATIFQTYRSLHINPGLGVAMSKDSWHALLSTPVDLHSEDIRPVNVIWSGNVLCLESSQIICSLDVAEPQPNSSSANPGTTMDRINSLRVIKRIPSRRLFTLLHTIRIQNTMTCFPRHENDASCEHASYLLKSLRTKADVLLLEISFLSDGHDLADQTNVDGNSTPSSYTRQALLHSTIGGSGLIEVLEGSIDLSSLALMTQAKHAKARPFSLAMMDKSLNKLGAFVEQVDTNTTLSYRLDELPSSVLRFFKPPEVVATGPVADTKPSGAKPLPGETVGEMEAVIAGPSMAESIDELCLEIRKTYLKYLYQDEYTVSDYVKRLNAASKEITALAAKQSVPLKEAQQKLVAFMIEFLRIWPSRMGSKYKQIAKEVNVPKFESRTQDHYAILDDERLEVDSWKAETMQSVKDADVRMQLKKLKTKDTQIQIVQNLHILLLINKYGLEENKPFKKDPGALKAITLFMDELCIAASLESNPEPGLCRSPQTPRSKDMDSAKKFFTRIIARYYELSLPKVVEKLSIKCGMEKSLLSSPRPSRGSKQPGMKRSVSLGTLEKPSPLDFAAALLEDGGEGPLSSSSSSARLAVSSKPPAALTRRSTTDSPARSILNKAIFRNRQVVMTRGSVKGVGAAASSSSGNALPTSATMTTKKPAVAPIKPHPEMEDEDAPPALAKLRLKDFYHDKESEEVLRSLRRQQPLSKADAAFHTHNSQSSIRREDKYVAEQVIEDEDEDDEQEEDDDEDNELGTLEKYLRRKGTTSWGVIKSVNVSSSRILKSPSNGAAQRRISSNTNNNGVLKARGDASPSTRYTSMNSLLLPSDSVVPSTPKSKQGHIYHQQQDDPEDYNTIQKSPSTPTGRSMLRRHQTYNGIPRVDDLTELLPRLARRRSRGSLEDLLADERPAIRRREV